MMLRLILVWLFCFCCVAVDADAGHRYGGAASSLCPKGTAYTNVRGDGDGCAGAPTGIADNVTLFQHPTYFAGYANQSGQTYTKLPTLWNVAAVDYPVGIPSSVSFKNPATDTLPSGCTYSATGGGEGGPVVSCVGATNPTFDGWDFTGRKVGSPGCAALVNDNTGNTGGGTLTVKNSYFCLDAKNSFVMIWQPDGAGELPIDAENDVFDGGGLTSAHSGNAILENSTPAITVKYSVFLRIPGDPISGLVPGSDILQYNYLEGMMYAGDNDNQGHGEFHDNTYRGTHTQTIWEFNNMLLPNDVSPRSTTFLNGTAGFDDLSITWSDLEVLNNVGVANTAVSFSKPSMGEGLAYIAETQTATLFEDNYFDDTGSSHPASVVNAACTVPIVQARNFYLTSGSALTLFDQGGNTGCGL